MVGLTNAAVHCRIPCRIHQAFAGSRIHPFASPLEGRGGGNEISGEARARKDGTKRPWMVDIEGRWHPEQPVNKSQKEERLLFPSIDGGEVGRRRISERMENNKK